MDTVFAKASKLLSSRLGTTIDSLVDEEGFTVAMRAVQGNELDGLKALVQRLNASVGPEARNQYGFTTLHLAAFHEASSELVSFLLEHSPTLINTQESGGWTPLVVASSKGNLRLVKLLLEKAHPDVNAKTYMDQTALYIASNNGFLNVVNLLLDHGADAKIRVKKSLESPAIAAITSGHLEILRRLIEHEPELLTLPTVSGATILHAAAQIGRESTVRMLVEAGADMETTKKDGMTVLACAASLGHSHIVRLLLEHGASLECRNGFGGTPLHLACNAKQLEMVRILLEAKADPNVFDSDRISPLQSLCSSSVSIPADKRPPQGSPSIEIQIFDLLVEHGADLGHKDRCNAIFLHQLVCKTDNLSLLQHVISKYGNRFDPFIEDRFGHCALHVAHRYKHTAIIDELGDFMSSLNADLFSQFDPEKPRIEPPIGICDMFETMDLAERQAVLSMDLSLKSVALKIRSGLVKNIVILSGAGISTNSGIPDFRSPGKGLYTSPHFKAKYGEGGLSGLFNPGAVEKHPEDFFDAVKEIFGPAVDGRYKPTPAHFFIRLLHDKGILRRNYTQNIDMLERLAGVPKAKLVEAHGSFAKASCVKCHAPCDNMQDYWHDIQGDIVPRCTACRSVVRPDVVFFGESLPADFTDLQGPDFKACDLLIVMGTSLKVYPFAGLTNSVTNTTPRLLLNNEAVGAFVHGAQWKFPEEAQAPSSDTESSSPSSITETDEPKISSGLERIKHKKEYTNSYRDVAVLGDIDQAVLLLAKEIGWEADMKHLMDTYKPSTSFQ
jgi:NAD-dependent deacetylase sirtuin 2